MEWRENIRENHQVKCLVLAEHSHELNIYLKEVEEMNTAHDVRDISRGSKSPRLWIVLLKDLGDYALYFNKTDNCFAGFEVHEIRIRDAQECDIKRKDGSVYHLSVPKRHVIAGSEEFGVYAWHYPNIDLVYEKHPDFKKHSQVIESKLKDALITVQKRFLRVYVDKTTMVGSKPSILKPKSDVTAQKDESIVLCKHCNYHNRIVRAFFWSGHNKGKIKPISDMLCPNCGHLMGHNVIDGVSDKNSDCLKMR